VFDASVSTLATTGLIAGSLVALSFTRKGLAELRKLITELRRLVSELHKLSVTLKSIRAHRVEPAAVTHTKVRRKKDSQSVPVSNEVSQNEGLANRSP
jgi:hypothetical protein